MTHQKGRSRLASGQPARYRSWLHPAQFLLGECHMCAEPTVLYQLTLLVVRSSIPSTRRADWGLCCARMPSPSPSKPLGPACRDFAQLGRGQGAQCSPHPVPWRGLLLPSLCGWLNHPPPQRASHLPPEAPDGTVSSCTAGPDRSASKSCMRSIDLSHPGQHMS